MIANANITKFNKTTKFILIVFKHVLNAKKRATKKVALTIVLLPTFNQNLKYYFRFSIKIRSTTPDFQCFFNRFTNLACMFLS